MHVGCYEFMTIVNSQDLAANAIQLITVSDGSNLMTFGWVIATPDGRRLARCSGPVFGPFGSSFHAEGYGFLSVSRFLVRLQEFCATAPTWCIRMMTGNQGLITRLELSLPYIDPFPNITLTADWNVTNEILKSLRELLIPPNFAHVKGHQDDHPLILICPLMLNLTSMRTLRRDIFNALSLGKDLSFLDYLRTPYSFIFLAKSSALNSNNKSAKLIRSPRISNT
jgi:hypothetical protein